MRSSKRQGGGQASLWDEEPVPSPMIASAERSTRRPRATRRAVPAPAGALFDPSGVLRLEGDEFARTGWPAGTLMHLTPAQRATRGDLVVVREAGRTRVGWFGADRGRPALLTDLGATWLSDRARVVALVTAVEATLGS